MIAKFIFDDVMVRAKLAVDSPTVVTIAEFFSLVLKKLPIFFIPPVKPAKTDLHPG